MNLTLLRNFLLEYLPNEAQIPVADVLDGIEKNPVSILNNGLLWNHFNYFKSPNINVAVASANGIVLGFALAYAVHKYPHLENELQAYLDASAKRRGDNVVNFLQRKGK